MPLETITNYAKGPRRPSPCSISASSSKLTEDDAPFTCPRSKCHCEWANRDDDELSDALDTGLATMPRRQGEYFHRPPVLAPYNRVPGLDVLSYTYLYGENGESQYCDQCRFCSQQGRWCGRRPVSPNIKIPKQLHRTVSEKEFGNEKQFKSFNATWVQEPLIVNTAQVCDENLDPREPFQPAVFSNRLTSTPSILMTHQKDDRAGSSESLQRTYLMSQAPATNCARLKWYRDVRLPYNEHWVIEEGSLVISVHPSFVDLNQDVVREDEFRLRHGDVYVVCRLYADMWALCAQLQLSEVIFPVKNGDTVKSGLENIKFLPLCAVTLAANFGSFERRWVTHRKRHSQSKFFPGGGLCITPPKRSHSLEASRQLRRSDEMELSLPRLASDVCKAHHRVPAGIAYAPYDIDSPPTPPRESNSKETLGGKTLRQLWKKFVSNEPSTLRGCLPRGPGDSSLQEISYIQNELALFQQELDMEKKQSLKKSAKYGGGVKPRRSIRNLFFGSNRKKEMPLYSNTLTEKSVCEEKGYH